MTHHHCNECGEPIENGQAHIRSINFEQVAWCDFCWNARQGQALAELLAS